MIESRILLVDDEEDMRHSSAQALELAGFRVETFAAAERALEFISFSFAGVVISDIRMPGMDGMTLLQRVREIDAEVPVILVTGHGDVQLAVRAMREGAYDFVEKPFAAQMLAGTIRRALDWRTLVLENRRLKAVAGKRDDIEQRLPGRSQVMVDLRYRIRAIGAADADTLIIGDTGVGKEVLARTLHDLSARANNPFIAINCAALPENLIESELFGHEPGAFPGAIRPRYGKFEHGRGGTILLDEIGSMPFDLQAKFLRVLQERVITRLGSNEVVPLDVRFIATSKVDLEREVAAGRFRADLLYRLNVATLRVPLLAQRRADIPLLFLQLIRESAARYGRDEVEVSQAMLAEMAERDWPGNVRELRNLIERSLILGSLNVSALYPGTPRAPLAERPTDLHTLEKMHILSVLDSVQGDKTRAAQLLGVSRRTLERRVAEWGA